MFSSLSPVSLSTPRDLGFVLVLGHHNNSIVAEQDKELRRPIIIRGSLTICPRTGQDKDRTEQGQGEQDKDKEKIRLLLGAKSQSVLAQSDIQM